MPSSRRHFLKSASATALGSSIALGAYATPAAASTPDPKSNDYADLDRILAQPVLKKELFPSPVIIDRLELLRLEDNFLCHVTSTDGAEGISVGNNMQMIALYPIFTHRLQPFFIGKDAREWEQLLEEVYVHQSNYKLQNLALWGAPGHYRVCSIGYAWQNSR